MKRVLEIAAHIVEVNEQGEYLADLVAFASHLGFEHVSAMAVIDRPDGEPKFFNIDNMPVEWADGLGSSSDLYKIDPVMQHCKSGSLPILWDKSTYEDVGLLPMWEDQAKHGYRSGLAMALHLPDGRHFMLGLDQNRDLGPVDRPRRDYLFSSLHLFALHAQDSAFRIFHGLVSPDHFGLTPAEVDLVRSKSAGKQWSEISEALGVGEATALRYGSRVARKMGAAGIDAAVSKARKIGII